MDRRKLVATVISSALALSLRALAEEKKTESKAQTTCPVMGGKINKAQYADVKGKRIYVCCPGCIGKIKADPDKYIKKMEAEGIMLDKTPQKGEHEGHKDDHSGHQH
jgi:YHS domain-containing protein